MATKSGEPVGPFPDGVDPVEYDRLRRRVLWTFPYGLYAVGSRAVVDGVDRRNMMVLNWATQVAFEPKLVGIGVEHDALTHRLIADGGAFSLGTIDREDRAIVRKLTKPVDVDEVARTMNGFPYHDGRTGSPILDAGPAWIECEVRQAVPTGGHTFFIGEVVDAGFAKAEDTPVLRMEDTRMSYGG